MIEETKPNEAAQAGCAAATCSAFVRVLRHGDTEPEWASKLVWWLAAIASVPPREWREPRVGDIVVETTHRIGMARHGLGLVAAVGELLKIEETKEQGKTYTIRTLEGKEQRWSNAMMAVVERPNSKLSHSAWTKP